MQQKEVVAAVSVMYSKPENIQEEVLFHILVYSLINLLTYTYSLVGFIAYLLTHLSRRSHSYTVVPIAGLVMVDCRETQQRKM